MGDASGDSAAFVETVLTALPEEALQRGVYTEDAMRERFFKVERLCKRVSMIGDEGGSLFKYALSYLQALLVSCGRSSLWDGSVLLAGRGRGC